MPVQVEMFLRLLLAAVLGFDYRLPKRNAWQTKLEPERSVLSVSVRECSG